MLAKVRIQNFKCLRDVTVDLGPFTVLIGPNDSGKSSFLDALLLVNDTARRPWQEVLQGPAAFGHVVWKRDPRVPVILELTSSSGPDPFDYRLLLTGDRKPPLDRLSVGNSVLAELSQGNGGTYRRLIGSEAKNSQDPSFTALGCVLRQHTPAEALPAARLLSSMSKHRFSPQDLRKPAKLTANPKLSESGDNLAAVLDALISGPDRSAINALEDALRREVPSLKGLSLETVVSGNDTLKELHYALAGNERPPITVSARSVSEGALLLTAFPALVYGETAELLMIEEPENGLHPERLATVIDLLRRISTGAITGRPRQVVITTHNPVLLNHVEPREVRVFQRDPQNGTFVKNLADAPDIDKLSKNFATGELWYMLGEKKLFEPEPTS